MTERCHLGMNATPVVCLLTALCVAVRPSPDILCLIPSALVSGIPAVAPAVPLPHSPVHVATAPGVSSSFCLCTFFPVLSSWVHLLWSLYAGDIFDYSGQLSHGPFLHSDISFWSQKSRKFIGNEMQHPCPLLRGESYTLIAKYTHFYVYDRISALAPAVSTITG